MPRDSLSGKFQNTELKGVLLSLKGWILYLIARWKIVLLAVILGSTVGVLISILAVPRYYGKATFVLDQYSKSNPLTALAGTMMEMDLEQEDGLFSGDNLVWLYSSDRMIKETLLTVPDSWKESLMSRLLTFDGKLRKVSNKIGEKYPESKSFPKVGMDTMDLGQRYLLAKAIMVIRTDYLKVETEDKANGVIRVGMTSEDELFTLNFVQEIVNRVNSFYVTTKTQKAQEKVDVLERKVNDFSREMSTSMYTAASAADAIPNANPNIQTLRVKPEREVVDVQVSSTLYTTMIQQLELARLTLAEQTPLIQMIDSPILPLKVVRPRLIISIVLGAIISFIIVISCLVGSRYLKEIMKG